MGALGNVDPHECGILFEVIKSVDYCITVLVFYVNGFSALLYILFILIIPLVVCWVVTKSDIY